MLQGWNAVFDQIAARAALGLYGRWRFPGALSAVEASHAELWYRTLRATGQNTQVAHLHTFLAISHGNFTVSWVQMGTEWTKGHWMP